nr:aldehyde dehydrogenase family protein [Haloterrigena salifodinae]
MYGFSGSVHSKDRAQACRIEGRIDTGMIHITDQPIDDEPHVPFSGMKQIAVNRTEESSA